MDGNDLKELRELVEFLKANEIAEFDLERSDMKVRIKFTGDAPAPVPAGAPAPALDMAQLSKLLAGTQAAAVAAPAAMVALPTAAVSAPAPVAAAVPTADPNAGLSLQNSPIVGTFYDAPAPGAEPFVKIGDQVQVGTVLCIVEAMKLMNEIESEFAGEVVRVAAIPGQPVEYGQPLFAIKPR